MVRLILCCEGVPPSAGPQAAQDITDFFGDRPWYSNVKCYWRGSQLMLEAESDTDVNGLALMDEYSDALSACIVDPGEGELRVEAIIPIASA